MANCAQATLRGGEMVVECDDRWDCCQRAQAKAKVDGMNRALQRSSNPTIQPPGFDRSRGDAWCDSQRNRIDQMSSQGQANEARQRGAPECLAQQLEGDPTASPPKPPQTRRGLGLALDHPLDMKLGGPAMPGLVPIDAKVNGAFGSFAKNAGDQRGAGRSWRRYRSFAHRVRQDVRRRITARRTHRASRRIRLACSSGRPRTPPHSWSERMPELHNRTPGHVELVPLIDRLGSNVLAVICKVTYEIRDGEYLQIAPEQEAVTFADVTAGNELVVASDITIKLATDVVITRPERALETHPDRGRTVEIQIGSLRFGGAMSRHGRSVQYSGR